MNKHKNLTITFDLTLTWSQFTHSSYYDHLDIMQSHCRHVLYAEASEGWEETKHWRGKSLFANDGLPL